MYGNTGAKAAIEMALHDLVGRATGRPVHALLGAKLRSRMPLLAIVGSEDAAADLREAEARWALGYRAFKIKVGLAAAQADGVAHPHRLHGAEEQRPMPGVGRRQSGLWRRSGARLCARGRRLRARFFRAAGRGARPRRHGARRRGDPDRDRRRRGHSLFATISNAITPSMRRAAAVSRRSSSAACAPCSRRAGCATVSA